MKIGTFRRFFAKDYQDVPKGNWFEQLLGSLNLFTDPVITALRNGMTYADNFNCTVKSVTLESDVALQIGVNTLPSEVRIQKADGAMVTGFAWSPLKNNLISVIARFDDKKSHPTTLIIYY